jgi:hypothetical protein
MRASGSTSRIALTPAIAARHSARRRRSRSSSSFLKGATQPQAPPQSAKKLISLIGVKKCGPRTRGMTYSAAARQ